MYVFLTALEEPRTHVMYTEATRRGMRVRGWPTGTE